MRQAERDNDQLGAILRYCGRLDAALEHFGQTFEDFCTSVPFQDSCSLCLIQIGEATARLSDGFKEKHPEIDWRRIYGHALPSCSWLRNVRRRDCLGRHREDHPAPSGVLRKRIFRTISQPAFKTVFPDRLAALLWRSIDGPRQADRSRALPVPNRVILRP